MRNLFKFTFIRPIRIPLDGYVPLCVCLDVYRQLKVIAGMKRDDQQYIRCKLFTKTIRAKPKKEKNTKSTLNSLEQCNMKVLAMVGSFFFCEMPAV